MDITSVDAVVNFIVSSINVALCEDAKLNYQLLQLSCLSDVEVWPAAEHCLLQLSTELLSPWNLWFQRIDWCPPLYWFIAEQGSGFGQHLISLTYIHDSDEYLLLNLNQRSRYLQSLVGSPQAGF
jgi:hypothetical protein